MVNKVMAKKVFIRTFGCQMNIRDSEIVAGLFLDKGYRLAKSQDEADIILFNTCSVRKHAEDRVLGNIGILRKLKEKRPDLVVGVIGCMAQHFKQKLFEVSNVVDIVCGPSDEEKLPSLIGKFLKTKKNILSVENINKPRKEVLSGYRENKDSAYVVISHGCDNFCSYCIVPYVRGREISRKEKDIINEIKKLAAQGVKDIMLLGQNVNSYKDRKDRSRGGLGFIRLLEKINRIDGIERIRFMTSHPKDATEDLFYAIRDLDKVVKHLHLPLQSGSDKILKAMNRGYTVKKYISLVNRLREIIPGCRLTTDAIVGFPHETKKDFSKTCSLMKKIRFDAAYIFKYSPRPKTASSKLKDSVAKEEKERRNQVLLKMIKSQAICILFVVCIFGFGLPQYAFADMDQAEIAFLKGEHDLALANCDASGRGNYLKARILLKENKIQQAYDIFENILQNDSDKALHDVAQLGLADAFFAEERYDDAIGEYRKIQEKYAGSPFCALAFYKIAKCYRKLGQMEQARVYVQKLQQDYPLSFEAKLMDELDNSEFVYSVQVGGFSKYANAENLVNKLKGKGLDAYISEKEAFPVVYRVRVGKFKAKSDALVCKALLEKKGYKTKLCP